MAVVPRTIRVDVSLIALLLFPGVLASCGTSPRESSPRGAAGATAPAPAEPLSAADGLHAAPRGGSAPAAPAVSPGIIVGSVLEIDAPRAGTLVQLVDPHGTLLQATVDARGEYQIGDVPPGDYLLSVVDIPAVRSGVMTMKSRGVSVGPGELIEQNFIFGTGFRVHGRIEGTPEGIEKLLVALYRPGAPTVAGSPLSDRALPIEAAKFLAGSAYVAGTDRYEIQDVEPGSYRLEVTIPPDPATPRSERWPAPLFAAEITVEGRDLESPIAIRRR